MDGHVAVAKRLSPEWRRWVIAHAIGHRLLHPGNHLELRAHTDLPRRFKREAEDFARGLPRRCAHSPEAKDSSPSINPNSRRTATFNS